MILTKSQSRLCLVFIHKTLLVLPGRTTKNSRQAGFRTLEFSETSKRAKEQAERLKKIRQAEQKLTKVSASHTSPISSI